MITIVTPPSEAEEFGMRIPLSAVLENGELRIHACEEAMEAARWLDSLAPLSAIDEKVREELDRRLRPVMLEMGFEPEEGYIRQVSYVYRAFSAAQIDCDVIRPDTVRYHRQENHQYLTETALDAESDDCTIFATLRGDRVLSFANLNQDDGEVAEIGVETAPECEEMGLATSNAAALAHDLLLRGRERVVYVALSDNPASIRIAEKIGFQRAAEEYNYVCFRSEADAETDLHGGI